MQLGILLVVLVNGNTRPTLIVSGGSFWFTLLLNAGSMIGHITWALVSDDIQLEYDKLIARIDFSQSVNVLNRIFRQG